jgi:hypothetical protein
MGNFNIPDSVSNPWKFVPAKLVKKLIELADEFGWGEGWNDEMTLWIGPPPSPSMDAETVELRDKQGTLITSTLISATAASRR